MDRFIIFRTFVTAVLFFFFAVSVPMSATAAGSSLAGMLPDHGFARGWTIDGKVTLFQKDTLFDHINGEAELYFPYGFAELATATYTNTVNPDLAVVADVYKMGSLLDAFGIYSNYRRSDDTGEIKVGAEGFVSSSQLLFYQDRYFVRISVSGASSLDPEVLLALSRAIALKLPPPAVKPRELAVFGIPAIAEKSERYIAQSLLGYAFFRRGIVADTSLAGERVQVFVVIEDSAAAAQGTLEQYETYLRKSGQRVITNKAREGLSVSAIDPLFGLVMIERTGRYLVGAVRMKEVKATKPLVESLRKRLETGVAE